MRFAKLAIISAVSSLALLIAPLKGTAQTFTTTPSLRSDAVKELPSASRAIREFNKRNGTNEVPSDPIVGGGCMGGGCCSCPPGPAPQMGQEMWKNIIKQSFRGDLFKNTFVPPVIQPVDPLKSLAGSDRSACRAEETLRFLPESLKVRANAITKTSIAGRCHVAVRELSSRREGLFDDYDRYNPRQLSGEYVELAKKYYSECLTSDLVKEGFDLDQNDIKYLSKHVGMIVKHNDRDWAETKPICHAFRASRYVITAQHCVDPDMISGGYALGFDERIAFRHFDSPTLFALNLRATGSDGDPFQARDRDYAIFEIEAPELAENSEEILIGKPNLFEDFVIFQSNIYSRIALDVHTGTSNRMSETATVEQSILCRPAHLESDGIFLHGCQTEGRTSGAPLFQKREGKLVFVGIHTGATDAIPREELSSCSIGLPNYGVSAPFNRLIEIMGERKK